MMSDPATERLILIVEDNPANLLLARSVLQRSGYRTVDTSSAEEAWAWLRTARPDLILMDVQLPGQDGLSLTRQLKADPLTADIPIVALTAHAMATDAERALAAGCDGYITKPIDIHRFAAEVAAVLQPRRHGQPEVP
jgi:CheY-like chemotaxis protein